jgi:hypothetical protein
MRLKRVEARCTTTRNDSTTLDLASPRRLPTPRSSTPAPTLSPLSIPTIPGVFLLIAVLLLPVGSSSCFRILVPNLRYQTLWSTAMKHHPPTHPQTDTHIQRRPVTSRSTEDMGGGPASTAWPGIVLPHLHRRTPFLRSFVSQGLALG